MKRCILEDKDCIQCNECNMCDINPTKVCDNCMDCLDTDSEYKGIIIDGVKTDRKLH